MHLRQHSMAKPSGHITVTFEDGRELTSDTVQCACCQRHFPFSPHIHRTMGYCAELGGFACGRCVRRGAVHRDQRLDNREAGKDPHHRPTVIAFPRSAVV